jgi:F-type H+-transporting ATPase subunit a
MRSAGRFLLTLAFLSAAAGGATAGAQEVHSTPAATQPHAAAGAQQPGISPAEHNAEHGAASGPVDIITPHITDSHHIEYPCLNYALVCEATLPHWAPVQIPGIGAVDMSPTKHVVMLLLASLLCCAVLITAAAAHKRHSHAVGRPKGFAAGIEAMVLYLRNEVVLPNVGHHGDKYVPFVLTLFFFILFANLLGLIPYGSTATGNISVTLTLALITFVMIEAAGMRAQGVHYLSTIFYWNKDLPLLMRVPMFILMSPIELAGKFAKPFALTIRLFANMTAGHIIVLALIGLIFTFGNIASGAPFLMAVAIMMLELFVAFLQAFIFSLLAAVFIGQIRESHH